MIENINLNKENRKLKNEIEEKNAFIEILKNEEAQVTVIDATNVRDQSNEPDSVEEMELDEPDLNILVKNKKAGFRRSAPQTEPYQTRIEDGSFTCSVCQFEANSKQNLMKHKNTAHNTKEIVGRYTCEICGNNFQSSEELHIHFSCHLNSCDQCFEMFQSKNMTP